jgi:deoxyribose-phosphate aldolase
MSDLSRIDPQQLLERVASEVARRYQLGVPIPKGGGNIGPPFCAACDTPGRCASVCGDSTRTITSSGANRIGGAPGIGPVEAQIAAMIDHTLLKPDATKDQIAFLCAEAAKYRFASVCVNPFWVPYCAELLRGHDVAVCTVVGFPLGCTYPEVKAMEARRAIESGATEIDMVLNIGALKSGLNQQVEDDIRAVKQACGPVILKVILETALLNDHEKVAGCEASMRAGADFVKTSTGFSTGGATAGDVALMRRVVGEGVGVKASGGVRNKADASLMMRSGASRICASAGVKIMQEVAGLAKGLKKLPRADTGGGY